MLELASHRALDEMALLETRSLWITVFDSFISFTLDDGCILDLSYPLTIHYNNLADRKSVV